MSTPETLHIDLPALAAQAVQALESGDVAELSQFQAATGLTAQQFRVEFDAGRTNELNQLLATHGAHIATSNPANADVVYTISVTYELRNEDSYDFGEAFETGYKIKEEPFELDELQRLIRNHGFSQASSSGISHAMFFSTETPEMDKAYLEKGIETFYALHLNAVNGQTPESMDYADIARLCNIRLKGMEFEGTRIPSDEEPEEPQEISAPESDGKQAEQPSFGLG